MLAQNNQTFNFALILIFLLSLHSFFVSSIDHSKVSDAGTESLILTRKIADDNVETDEILKKRYIVRFLEYKKAEDHRDYLEKNLRSNGWEWIERRNLATSFSTDFGLVSIWESFRTVLVEELRRLGSVKDVTLEQRYSRRLLVENGREREVNAKNKEKMKMSRKEMHSALENSTESLFERASIALLLGATKLWARGYTGAKIKIAVFDTGIQANHPHFRNIKEHKDWTNEGILDDNDGHGTFVAGIIAGQAEDCLGFAPDVDIYSFRIFNKAKETKTSWMLDAFNYAIESGMDVLNLSFGGSDYMDLPFVEKVREVTANNIIVIASTGNSGPSFGTVKNPADQNDVIGVGGINYIDQIDNFSSRGMTTWEIPHGYGRVKPDIVSYGEDIMGPNIGSGCTCKSGTSFSTPVVAGVVCLLLCAIPENTRKDIINPASMKQVLVEGATKLFGSNIYEQGAGSVNLLQSYKILKNYQPRASIFPSVLDYTDCSYTLPLCRQPLYAGAMPVIFNATILNGMGVIGYIDLPPVWKPSNGAGSLLSIKFSYSDVIWPWTGFLGLHMQINEEGAQYSGLIEGNVILRIADNIRGRSSTCVLRLKLEVVPTPLRSQRILWDQFHSIKEHPGFIPGDSPHDDCDWKGDHLHTNFYKMFNTLRDAGFYVETLGSPLTCFDASQYGTLLMVDPEDEYFKEEIEKLVVDVNDGLGLAVFADWYDIKRMINMSSQDHDMGPVTGGANVPALNKLLEPFGIAFGYKSLSRKNFSIGGEKWDYLYGTDIVKFPQNGYMHPVQGNTKNLSQAKVKSSVLGFVEIGSGRIAVYGDSDCLDSTVTTNTCYWLLRKVLDFTSNKTKDPILFSDKAKQGPHPNKEENQAPYNGKNVNFSTYSRVVGKDLFCGADSRFEVWETKGYDFSPKKSRKLT